MKRQVQIKINTLRKFVSSVNPLLIRDKNIKVFYILLITLLTKQNTKQNIIQNKNCKLSYTCIKSIKIMVQKHNNFLNNAINLSLTL